MRECCVRNSHGECFCVGVARMQVFGCDVVRMLSACIFYYVAFGCAFIERYFMV